MAGNDASVALSIDAKNLGGRVARLATERGALFDKAGSNFGLSAVEQERLAAIERELDECFLVRRRLRAERDSQRFDRENPFLGRLSRRPTSS
ncbi:MAG TPA: hypothetical protein VL856_09910 [Acidimicrobiia bacterium]|jgi:hypothetical protein|nr:hypothetical protein [Acidimicrobiia bacterium]